MKTISKIFGFGSAMLLALTMATTASAAPVPCPTTIGGDTGYNRQMTLDSTPATTCYDAGEGNEKYADLITKWNDVGDGKSVKVELGADGINAFLTFTGLGGPSTGTFTLINTLSADAIIVFKFGSGPGKPGVSEPDWVAYKLNGATSGTWTWSGTTALSHVSIYGSTREVPEPTTLGLMGLGLLGIGLRMRRRQTA